MIFLFPPAAIVLGLINPYYDKKVKIGIGTFLLVALGMGLFASMKGENVPVEVAQGDFETRVIVKNCNVTNDQASAIKNILQSCAVTDYDSLKLNDKRKDKVQLYYVMKNDKHTGVNLFLENGLVKSVALPGKSMLYSEGKVVARLSDFTMSANDQAIARSTAKKAVKKALNFPDSADFPFLNWSYACDKDTVQVRSTVEAVNAFNTKRKIPFTVEMKRDCKTVTAMEINGKRVF